MLLKIRLFKFNEQASDGSYINEEVFDAYLNSPNYTSRYSEGRTVGGSTHTSRQKKESTPIGIDDQMLQDNNTTHKLESLAKEDGWAIAYLRMFNPELFGPQTAEKIQNIIGLIKSKVLIPISSVINAVWGSDGGAQLINDIKGVDWTFNNAFRGSKVVEVLEKSFSSSEGGVATRTYSGLDYEVIDESHKKEENKEFSISNSPNIKLAVDLKEKDTEDYVFSTQQVISLKMRELKLNPREKFFKTWRSYERYYSSNKSKFSEKEEFYFEQMFYDDVLSQIQKEFPKIIEGRNIGEILGIQRVAPSLTKLSRDLSRSYKKTLRTEQANNSIPKNIYSKNKELLFNFLRSLYSELTNS